MHLSPRTSVIALASTLTLTTACTNKKVSNPLAKVDSKQPDKVLFDRGMDSMKHNHYDIARLDMQTLINTYPDSEFIARAKLAMADSWYAEGGTAIRSTARQTERCTGWDSAMKARSQCYGPWTPWSANRWNAGAK